MRERSTPTPVGALLEKVLREESVLSANPVGEWCDIVGEQGAAASQPVSLKKGTLLVVARDAVWKHHLELSRALLLSRINGEHKEPVVERLVIKVGALPETPPPLDEVQLHIKKLSAPKGSTKKKVRKAPKRALTPQEKTFLKTIGDPELRNLGRRLLQFTRSESEEE